MGKEIAKKAYNFCVDKNWIQLEHWIAANDTGL